MPAPSHAAAGDALTRVVSSWLLLLAFCFPISIAAASLTFFPLAGLYVLGAFWTFRRWPPPWGAIETAFCVFWALSVVSALAGVSFPASQMRLGKDLYIFLILLLGALLPYLPMSGHRLLKVFLWGSLVTAAFAILQVVVGINRTDITGDTLLNLPAALAHWPRGVLEQLSLSDGRATGLRNHPLRFAETLLFPLAYLLSLLTLPAKRSWWKGAAAAGVLLLALLLTQSRGPWMAFGVMALTLPFLDPQPRVWRRTALLIAFPLVLLMAVPSLRSRALSIGDSRFHSNSERLIMWKAGARIIKDHPWLGVGPGNVKRVSPEYQTPEQRQAFGAWGHLHNTYITLAAERGLLGLGAFGLFIGTIGAGLWGALRRTTRSEEERRIVLLTALLSLTGWLVCGLTEMSYHDTTVMMLFYFVMGIALSYCRT